MASVVKEVRVGGTARVDGPAATAPVVQRSLSPIGVNPTEPVTEGPVGAKQYWLGTLDQCPVQNVSLAGRTFHRITYRTYHVDGERMPRKIERRGAIEWLTAEQIEQIKTAAANKFVRRVGERAVLWQPRPNARARFASDEQVGSYIYCLPIEDAARILGPGWQDAGSPPPLVAPAA